MACLYPPPLTQDQITAVLDGVADQSVTAHAARCPECGARVAEAQQIERRLAHRLYRWDCPDAQVLMEYQLSLLDPGHAASVAQHAQACVVCRSELDDLRTFLADEASPAARPARQPQPRQQRASLGEWIARLVPQSPALALRGGPGGPLTAQAGDVLIVLDVQRQAPAGLVLLGQLAAPEPERWNGALVQLWQAGALKQIGLVDEVSGFRLEAVEPGTAELRIIPASGPTLVWSELGFTP